MKIRGVLNPGSIGRSIQLQGAAALNLSPTSHLITDVGGILDGEFDRLIINSLNTITLDGTLTVNHDVGHTPALADSWEIISGGVHTGKFASINTPTAPLGQLYRVFYESDHVFVILTCDADLSGDASLDFFDVSAFLDAFAAQEPIADFTNDGEFDFFDVSEFLDAFASGCP